MFFPNCFNKMISPSQKMVNFEQTLQNTLYSSCLCHAPFVIQHPQIQKDSGRNNTVWWRAFSLPTVYAEAASATDKMENAQREIPLKGMENILTEMEINQYMANETGMDRVRRMFSLDHRGNYSPEVSLMTTVIANTAAITMVYKSLTSVHTIREDFAKRNQMTVFKTRFMAERKLHDTVYMRTFLEGTKWGFRAVIFTGVFLLVSQTISVYRNKTTPWEYMVAGATSGTIAKFFLGPSAMAVGGIVGGVLGFLGGLSIYAFLVTTNQTQEQRHYWQIQEMLTEDKIAKGKAARNPPAEVPLLS